jgi:hypothetical protein
MKYKEFFTEMSSLGMNFSAPQPDFDTYTEEVSDDFSVFAQKRFDGAKKISDTAKEKGGPATLTYHHFVVKLPYYQKAIDGAFDIEEATQELEQHLQKLSSDAATMEQIEFQELVGIIEVLGELIIKNNEINKINEAISLLEKNTPTSPDKWAKAKAAARSKFKVYPSAYANLWASKKYKSMGGGWKKAKKGKK